MQAVLRGGRRPRLPDSDIEEIFGLELEPPAAQAVRPATPPASPPAARRKRP